MPENTRFVGRPSIYGNPFLISDDGNRWILPKETLQKLARDDFQMALQEGRLPYTGEDIRRELGGKNLACRCKEGKPCHADNLLKSANG
ncbi:MAG: DUF4326 domain-containing protein [Nitrospiria bacterium]